MILSNTMRRLGRTLLTALGIAVGVATIVALLSLTEGLRQTASGFTHLGNSDLGVFQRDASDPTTSILPESLVSRLRAQSSYVAEAAPLILMVEAIGPEPSAIVFGAEPAGFFSRSLVLLEGRPAASGEALAGDTLARQLHLRPGSSLTVSHRPLRVAGVYHSGILFEDSGAIIPLSDAQRLTGRTGEETSVAVRLATGARAATATRFIERRFPGTQVIADPQEAARAGANNVLISKAIVVLVVVALLVGAISVTNTMAMAIIERQGELAVLSTVGWSSTRVALLILGEGIVVSFVGAGVGLLLGVIGSGLLVDALGVGAFVSPAVTAWGLGRGLLVGVAIGVLGGVYPAWRVTRMRPLRALARV